MTVVAAPSLAESVYSESLSDPHFGQSESTAVRFDHHVHFYETDTGLYASVLHFFGDAVLPDGDAMILFATPEHCAGLAEHMAAHGVDVAALTALGRLVFRDARETLATFMVDGMPEPQLTRVVVQQAIRQVSARSTTGRVRVYGEMVNLLWADGDHKATVVLEQIWNQLGRAGSFSLLCGYFIGHFRAVADGDSLRQICSAHVHAGPTEVISMNGEVSHSDARGREVGLLQAEIEHRKRLEQALQEALMQRHRAEEALRTTQEALLRQNEDLSRTVRFSEMFVGILGHDLRNPLSAITTAASLLRKRAESDKVAKPAARILNSAGRMGRMIDQVLDFTRIRLGKGIPIEHRETDLVEICRMAIDEMETAVPAGRIDLQWVGNAIGLWDPDRVLQLISNLLSNALTHGTATVPVVVHVGGGNRDDVELQIQNAGVVPDAIMPLLFEPFESGSHAKQERSNGLGLGLYIGQQIVLAHGGTISVTSTEAAGTRFVVRLPRSPSPAEIAPEAGTS